MPSYVSALHDPGLFSVDDWEEMLQPGTPLHSKLIALRMMQDNYGWGIDEFQALDKLWERESNWDYRARNPLPNSTAWGIPQMLGRYHSGNPERAWREDDLYATSPDEQIRRGLEYIATGNFGVSGYNFSTPIEALQHHMGEGTY